jgi:hypothetical protein
MTKKGYKHSKETRAKISSSLKGRFTWNKGKKMTEEYKLNLRKPKKNITKKMGRKKGFITSKETKYKMSIAHKGINKGKTLEQISGPEKAIAIRRRLSESANNRKVSEKTRNIHRLIMLKKHKLGISFGFKKGITPKNKGKPLTK